MYVSFSIIYFDIAFSIYNYITNFVKKDSKKFVPYKVLDLSHNQIREHHIKSKAIKSFSAMIIVFLFSFYSVYFRLKMVKYIYQQKHTQYTLWKKNFC